MGNQQLQQWQETLTNVSTTSGSVELKSLERWSSFDYRRVQSDVLNNYQPIWPWFFTCEQYRNWRKGKRWHLHCHSDPGCGKTTFAAETARHLQFHSHRVHKSENSDTNLASEMGRVAVIVLFLGRKNEQGEFMYAVPDPITIFWRTVMRQILEILLLQHRASEIFDHLSAEEMKAPNLPLPMFRDRVNTILNELFDQVYIIIDDLDICPKILQSDFKAEVAHVLRTDRDDMKTGVLSVGHYRKPELIEVETGEDATTVNRRNNRNRQRNQNCDVPSCESPERPVLYWRCQDCLKEGVEFDVCQPCYDLPTRCENRNHILAEPYSEVMVQLKVASHDMSSYVRDRIREACERTRLQKKLTDDLRDALVSSTVHTAAGSLVIAKTYVDYLFRTENHEELTGVLTHVAEPEAKFFGSMMRTIRRRPEAERRVAFHTLFLISTASYENRNRRLDFEEIADALSILDPQSEYAHGELTLNQLLTFCDGLLEVSPGDRDLIGTFHANLDIYLHEEPHHCFDDIDPTMTELCLRALTTTPELATLDFRNDPLRQALLDTHPFLVYASQCWGYHLAQDPTDDPFPTAHAFLDDPHLLDSSLYIACTSPVDRSAVFDVWPGSHLLHVCALFGTVELLAAVADDATAALDLDVREPVHARTPLIIACQHGSADVVAELLERGANPDVVDRAGRSAVYEAVDGGFADIVQMFVRGEHWGALNRRSEGGRTPLVWSLLRSGREVVFRLLVARDGVDVNVQDDMGWTALMYAVHQEDGDAVDLLLAREDIDLAPRDRSGQTVLHIAAALSDSDIQRRVFAFAKGAAHRECLDVSDAMGSTPLMILVDTTDLGDPDVVRMVGDLIQFGCKVDCVDELGRGLLHHACTDDSQLPVVNMLCAKGLSPSAGDKRGWTPLHSACAHGASLIVDRLLDIGADVLRTDMPDALFPSDVARLFGFDAIARKMRAVEERRARGRGVSKPAVSIDPLWVRIFRGECDDITSLSTLSYGEVAAVDPDSHQSALHYAVLREHLPLIRVLVKDDRVVINAASFWGETPLHQAACLSEGSEIMRTLLDAGANTEVLDPQGMSPLARARKDDAQSANTLLLLEYSQGPIPPGEDTQIMFNAAIRAQNRIVIDKLLESGASMLQHDKKRALLPVHVAEEVEDEDFLEWMRSKHRDATRVFEEARA